MFQSLTKLCIFILLLTRHTCSYYVGINRNNRQVSLLASRASSAPPSTTTTTEVLDKPKWASGGFVSDLVNALISFQPLFSLMKLAARQTLINTVPLNLFSNSLTT